ncbi:penicillin-binding protein 1b [Klebsiella pneumoniae]|uniref:Penicillin-binding protein 1b n=1 Tax=Klebsiella pneumoniae TaxID=573 RepID=A0A377XKP9_KLEPN|nr:penicillin-binding protein 1b [Klebsiella pneumoniae]
MIMRMRNRCREKAKGKGGKPRRKRSWLWLLVKLGIVFAVLIAAYGVYLDQKIRSRIDGKVWELPAAVYGRMVNLEPDMQISKKRDGASAQRHAVSPGQRDDAPRRIYRAG